MAILAGEKNPVGSKENGKLLVIGFSIETTVNATKRALNLKTSPQCVVQVGKFELI